MRFLYILVLFLFSIKGFGQSALPEFSDISGRGASVSNMVKVSGGYVCEVKYFDNNGSNHWLYKISEEGIVVDSFNLQGNGKFYLGMPFSSEGNLYYLGTHWNQGTFYTQKYSATEFDENLNIVREFGSSVFDVGKGFFYFYQTDDGHANRIYDYSVYKDTIFGVGRYLMVDSPSVITGQKHFFFKGNMNGEVYQDFELGGTLLYNAFFRNNKMYMMGDVNDPANPWLPRAVGVHDSDGKFIKGWVFDNSNSGEFPWGSVGGAIDDKLFFSYLGRDPTLSGCSDQNVAVDVRDTNFVILHRFKLDECGYRYAGNMPFAKGKDGSIYFQAVHQDYKSFIVQKYNSEMQLIWSKPFSFDNDLFVAPLALLPTEDGGVLAHIRQEINGFRIVRLVKISPNGDIVSTNTFGSGIPESSVLAPNPCRDQIHYIGGEAGLLEVRIYDLNGRLVKNTPLTNNVVDVSSLMTGLYSVLIFDVNNKNRLLHRQTVVKVE